MNDRGGRKYLQVWEPPKLQLYAARAVDQRSLCDVVVESNMEASIYGAEEKVSKVMRRSVPSFILDRDSCERYVPFRPLEHQVDP